MIVFDDADVEAVVEGVKVAGYDNAGQDCTAACSVLAGARVHEVLVDELDRCGRVQAVRRRQGHVDRRHRAAPS